MVSLSENTLAEQENSTPLSDTERNRLRELVGIVNRGLIQFLEVGRALLAIRTERLYRETHDKFCRDQFGLGRSTCDQLVKSTQTAECLLASGVDLPKDISASTIHPIASLPDPELQVATWHLAQAASPQNGPTKTVVAKVARAIKTAIAEASPNGKGPWQNTFKRKYPPAELPFLRPIQKLSTWNGFDAHLAVSHITDPSRAFKVYQAAGIVIKRCEQVQSALSAQFPGTTMSPGQQKRLGRIRRRACREVREAFARGDITARRADILLYLPPAAQKRELQAWLAVREAKKQVYARAAEAIESYLEKLGEAKPVLPEVADSIRASLS
jgi:hypothetical protein